jgi:prevent-host-death family protein
MADDRYSTYEAKARFSELLKKVRQGRTVTITYHGEPVAELRPIQKKQGLAERMEWLESQGVIVRGRKPRGKLEPIAHRPGALKRFLEERD